MTVRVEMHLTQLPLDTLCSMLEMYETCMFTKMTADIHFFDDRADNTFALLYFSKQNDRLWAPTHYKSGCLILTMNQNEV